MTRRAAVLARLVLTFAGIAAFLPRPTEAQLTDAQLREHQAHVTGTVLDTEGRPIAKAKVYFDFNTQVPGDPEYFRGRIETVTDATGRYSIRVGLRNEVRRKFKGGSRSANVSGRDIINGLSHSVIVMADGYEQRGADFKLLADTVTRADVVLQRNRRATSRLVSVDAGGFWITDGVTEDFEWNFDRDFSSFERECEGDDGAAGFVGGAVIRQRVKPWLFAMAQGEFKREGRADFECAASGAGPPPRTLTIEGSRQFRTFTISAGPAVNTGPVTIFLLGGINLWRNEFRMEDRLVVGGQQVAGEIEEGERSGTDWSWTVGVERRLFQQFYLSARLSRFTADEAFPENTNRVPRDARRTEWMMKIAYEFALDQDRRRGPESP